MSPGHDIAASAVRQLYIFDTTLRDGAQTQGVDFSIDDKQKIANSLDILGVDYIEGGWPGANPTDTEFFNKDHEFKNAKLTAFGMTICLSTHCRYHDNRKCFLFCFSDNFGNSTYSFDRSNRGTSKFKHNGFHEN